MKLRTRLNLVLAGLTATFVAVLIGAEVRNLQLSLHEEIVAANRVASQMLGRLAASDSAEGGNDRVLEFLNSLGRVRANDITLQAQDGTMLYRSPQSTYKPGRTAPAWFSLLMAPEATRSVFTLPGGTQLSVQAEVSRAVLDAWDGLLVLLALAVAMLVIVNGLAFWLVDRALKPFPVITAGLARIEGGDLAHRLPPLPGHEARTIGAAFNRMAQSVQDKVIAERKASEAESRLEERRELAQLVEQKIEEERRLIAHELHDEFGQSVTAIRSLAEAISAQGAQSPATLEAAQLISAEAARLYDNMHGLIPRLTPFTLDTVGLGATLDSLVRDWQRRFPDVRLTARHELPTDLGSSVSLAIYRIVQEGLINALRHAQASSVDISVHTDGRRIAISVRDNGVGLPTDWARPGHFGLKGLNDRVSQLGGTFRIANAAHKGVELQADIPLAVTS
jgi:two-component system, NarL family, sensor histidine kinase UhpB